jgi:hypothetical protein
MAYLWFTKIKPYNLIAQRHFKQLSDKFIISAFRNEAANLPLLLDSISKLHYPKERLF